LRFLRTTGGRIVAVATAGGTFFLFLEFTPSESSLFFSSLHAHFLNKTRTPSHFSFLFFFFVFVLRRPNLSIVFFFLFGLLIFFFFCYHFSCGFVTADRVLPSNAVIFTFAHLCANGTKATEKDGDVSTTAQGGQQQKGFRVDECLTLSDLKYFLQHWGQT
jgi:hypothetical protein